MDAFGMPSLVDAMMIVSEVMGIVYATLSLLYKFVSNLGELASGRNWSCIGTSSASQTTENHRFGGGFCLFSLARLPVCYEYVSPRHILRQSRSFSVIVNNDISTQ